MDKSRCTYYTYCRHAALDHTDFHSFPTCRLTGHGLMKLLQPLSEGKTIVEQMSSYAMGISYDISSLGEFVN